MTATGREKKKFVYIQNFGCQMNVHDAQRMMEVLRPAGYEPTSSPDEADLILINTCSVREKPQAKVLQAVARLGQQKHARSFVLGVTGCVAEQEGARLFQGSPHLDLVVGPDHIRELPALVEEAGRRRTVQTGFVDVDEYSFLRAAPAGAVGPTSLVTIIKGCDNHCAYCIVPRVRGPEVSRPADEVVGEVRDLVAAGVREVTLIGQNVNSYRGWRGSPEDFVELLHRVDDVEGLVRLRFTTSHPKDFGPELAACFEPGALRCFCPWLHLPVQSGSTAVLQRMNRGYSREEYLQRVALARRCRADVGIGTDIIVGFPGETESQFLETVSLVEEIQYDYAFSFKYSVRPGTPAALLADDVPDEEKTRRLHHLQAVQGKITGERLARFVGRLVPVLVEGVSRRGAPQHCGRTPANHVVNFEADDGADLVGLVVDVAVTRAGSHSLTGARLMTAGVTGGLAKCGG